jgi:hypothetical protein
MRGIELTPVGKPCSTPPERKGVLRHRAALATVASLSALAFTFGLLEVGIRMAAPQPTKTPVPVMLDPDLIYRLPAYAKGTDVKEEFAVRIETNSFGLRDRDYASRKPHGVLRRILVLGDSMTFAEGVEAEETYPKVLERALLNRYEVINAAIRGYGTDQELLLFEKLIPVYHPDVVLLAVFTVNDFDDNLYGHLFDIQDNRLVRLPLSDDSSPKYRYYRRQAWVQHVPGYQWFIRYSHLANFVRSRWAWREFHRTFPTADADSGREDQAWRLTRSLLLAWGERARQAGMRPVLLLIPSWEQVSQGHDATNDRRAGQILALARDQGIPVVDPRRALHEAASGATPLYYPKDRHLTAAGHRIVADYLQASLSALGIVH